MRRWLQKTVDRSPDKWLPVIISTVISLAGVGVSVGTAIYNNHQSAVRDQANDAHAEARDKKIRELTAVNTQLQDYQRVTDRFDSAAQNYAGLILSKGRVDERAKLDLQANLLDQDRTLDRLASTPPFSEKANVVAEYRSSIVKLSAAVDRVTGVEDMAPYWANLNDVLVLRRELDQLAMKKNNLG